MNILFVSHCNFYGNSAMHIFCIANQLVEYGVSCSVCVPDKPGSVHDYGVSSFKVFDYSTMLEGKVFFEDGRGPDIIHAWTPRELVRRMTQCLAKYYRCRYIVHLEDNEEKLLEDGLYTESYDDLAKLPLKKLEEIIPEDRIHPIRYKKFLSEAAGITVLMDRLLEFKPDNVPAIVFWPGFDEEICDFRSDNNFLRNKYNIDSNENVIVYTGNIHPSNYREIGSLFLSAGLAQRRGFSIKIIKTGLSDPKYIEDLLKPVRSLVNDLGFVSRRSLAELISLSDVLVQPGGPNRFNDYRFPSKLPNYFVSGKPVILPRSNIGRFVTDGVNAILLEEGNALEIAQKIEYLLKNRRLRSTIGENGRLFALRKLRWSHNVQKIKKFYEQLLMSNYEYPLTNKAYIY